MREGRVVELGDETEGKTASSTFLVPNGFRDVREPPESGNVPGGQRK